MWFYNPKCRGESDHYFFLVKFFTALHLLSLSQNLSIRNSSSAGYWRSIILSLQRDSVSFEKKWESPWRFAVLVAWRMFCVCTCLCVCVCMRVYCMSDERTRRVVVENSAAILLPEADDSSRKTLNRRLSFLRLFFAHHDRLSCHLTSRISRHRFNLLEKKFTLPYIFQSYFE